MECNEALVSRLSWALTLGGVAYLLRQRRANTRYGRYVDADARVCPARLGWFLQEAPAFLLPLLLLLLRREELTGGGAGGGGGGGAGGGAAGGGGGGGGAGGGGGGGGAGGGAAGGSTGTTLLLCTFMLHYFHRSFIYAFRTRGRPLPQVIVLSAAIFCSLNGFLQGHHLLHCARFQHGGLTDARLAAGLLLFFAGLAINIHSDQILRRLRRPGEVVYKIPYGGMFEFVSGANFFGEIVEWCGYALAAGSFPAFAFAFFTICSIGPRAYHHHRDYQQRFEDYPRSRRALIPFIL